MSDSRDTRSTTGMVFTLYGCAISWQSRLQPTIASSTCEAVYMVANAACLEVMWLCKIMWNISHPPFSPTVIKCDKSALALLLNTDKQSSRVMHIDNRHHQCREEVESGTVIYEYCSSSRNIADCLTKPLPLAALESQRVAQDLGPVLKFCLYHPYLPLQYLCLAFRKGITLCKNFVIITLSCFRSLSGILDL